LRARPSLKRVALLTMTALALGAASFSGSTAALAMSDLERGVTHLEQANATLGTAPSGWSPERVGAAIRLQRDAEREIASAASRLRGNPLLQAGAVAPVAADEVRTVLDLGASAQDAAAAAGDLIQFVQVYERDSQGGASGPRLLHLLGESRQPFADARMHLDRADARLREALGRRLAPSLEQRTRAALTRLQPARKYATAASVAATYLPTILGLDGPRSYLLLLPNPSELRPIGGFVGAVGTITVTSGAPSAIEVHGEEDFDGKYGQAFAIPAALGRRLSFPNNSLDIGDAGWDPDYPSSARLSEQMYRAATGRNVEGTIAVDPYAIAALLKITGPIDVAPYGTFNADDFFAKLNQIVNIQKGPGSGKSALPPIAQALVKRVLAAPIDQWTALLAAGAEQARDRHVQLFLHDAASAGAVNGAGYDGALLDPGEGSDYLLVVDANTGGTKGDGYVRKSVREKVDVAASGMTRHELVLRYEYPSEARDATVAPGSDTAYRDFVRVYLPETSRVTGYEQVTGGRAGGMVEEDRVDHGKRAVGMGFRLPAGQATELHLSYVTPLDARQGYRLYIQKQAGVPSRPATIAVHGPRTTATREVAGVHDDEVAVAW
jgi:hypothetical protein